jgi:hypothetical protein
VVQVLVVVGFVLGWVVAQAQERVERKALVKVLEQQAWVRESELEMALEQAKAQLMWKGLE